LDGESLELTREVHVACANCDVRTQWRVVRGLEVGREGDGSGGVEWRDEVVREVVPDGGLGGDVELFVVGASGGRDDDALVEPPSEVEPLKAERRLLAGPIGERAVRFAAAQAALEFDDAEGNGGVAEEGVDELRGFGVGIDLTGDDLDRGETPEIVGGVG